MSQYIPYNKYLYTHSPRSVYYGTRKHKPLDARSGFRKTQLQDFFGCDRENKMADGILIDAILKLEEVHVL